MEHNEVIRIVSEFFKAEKDISLVSKGGGEFPNPDLYVQWKKGNKIKIGYVECKPSDALSREYLTGLGQCMAYLVYADYSYLAIPKKEMIRHQKFFWQEEIGLLSVLENNVEILRNPKESKIAVGKEKARVRGYGYYRDLKPLEIHKLLKAIYTEHGKEIEEINNKIWQTLCKMRELKSQAQKNAQLLNVKLLLRDLQLINSDFSLTKDGVNLIQLGNLSNKESYMKELAKCFLINANFIDILTLIQELNNEFMGFNTVEEFKEKLKVRIIKEKLATKKTNVKRDLQDIPRILNEIGILSKWKKLSSKITHQGKYNINWRRVISIIGKSF